MVLGSFMEWKYTNLASFLIVTTKVKSKALIGFTVHASIPKRLIMDTGWNSVTYSSPDLITLWQAFPIPSSWPMFSQSIQNAHREKFYFFFFLYWVVTSKFYVMHIQKLFVQKIEAYKSRGGYWGNKKKKNHLPNQKTSLPR